MNRLVPTLPSALMVALTAIALAGTVHADEKRREALAIEVMNLTGMEDIGAQVAEGLLAQLRPAFPTVPETLWAEIAESVTSEEIVKLSIPPYVKHFSEEELAGLIEFYKTPLGQTLLEKMPAVQYETMMIGNEWGQRKAGEIVEKLRSAGHEPKGQ